jgi:hypothetical protein
MAHEMTYEQWCEHAPALLKECETYNKWRDRTMTAVLTNLAPRIAALRNVMYSGCGFHYAKEQTLGSVITDLAKHYQWCANHCAKIPNERVDMIITRVKVEGLFKDIAEAEESAKNLAART